MGQIRYETLLKLESIGHCEKNAYILQGNILLGCGVAVGMATGATQNEVQTITAPGSGNFTLAFNGQQTAAIAFNATDATIQAAFVALSTVGAGNATVSSKAITFTGVLAGQGQPLVTDPTGAATIARTTAGRTQYALQAYTDGNASSVPFVGFTEFAVTSDNFGNMYAGASLGTGTPISSVPVLVQGRFNANDLTGLTTTALSGRGTVEQGSISTGVVRLF